MAQPPRRLTVLTSLALGASMAAACSPTQPSAPFASPTSSATPRVSTSAAPVTSSTTPSATNGRGTPFAIDWSPALGFSATNGPLANADGLARLGPSRYIVLGRKLVIDARSSMAAASTDGTHWRLAGPGLEPIAGIYPSDAAELADGTAVIVGTAVTPGAGDAGTSRGIVFRLGTDGRWSAVPGQSSLVEAEPCGVIATATGFVAYGATGSGGGHPCGGFGDAAGIGVWTSSNGHAWTRRLAAPTRSGTYRTVGIVAGNGQLLAFASRDVDAPATQLWASSDGMRWDPLDAVGLDGISLTGVIATRDGYLGVALAADCCGFDPDLSPPPSHPTVFRSPDGRTWAPIGGTTPGLSGIAAVPAGYVGWDNFIQAPDYGFWVSTDALSWTRVVDPRSGTTAEAYPNLFVGRLVSDGDLVLALTGTDITPVRVGHLVPAGAGGS